MLGITSQVDFPSNNKYNQNQFSEIKDLLAHLYGILLIVDFVKKKTGFFY